MKQTLGFLKKKRTKDPSAKDSDSQPNSPITPTSTRGFGSISESVNSTATTTHENPAVAGEQQPMTQGISHHQQTYAAAPQSASTVIPAGQQNLPTINNLINLPQHDGAAQSYPSQIMNQNHSTPMTVDGADHRVDTPQQLAQIPQPVQVRQTKGKYSLGDFELLRTLGTGSFGRVHLVQSKHNQRFYAVKVLKKQQVVKMKQVEHTNDERKMLQEVKHPFLITLWGTFQDSKNLYMVMDFVEGGELFSLLRKSQVGPTATDRFELH